jgi:gag-polypeptide of LTR copia-type/Zinc knuckle
MQMEALLEEKEVWEIVTGDEKAPTTAPTSKAMKLYVRRHKIAKAKIILHLDKSQPPHARFDTAKEIWDNLARVHRTRGFGTLLSMRRKFFYMTKDDSQSMQAWIASIWDAAYCLKAADFEVQDIDLIIALTHGLPDKYTPLIVSLDATPIDQLNIDSVITHLINEEVHQSHPDLGPIALIACSKLGKRTWLQPAGHKHCRTKSTTDDDHSSHSTDKCYNCGGWGHLTQDCPSLKQEGDRANFTNKDDDTASQIFHRTHASY